MYLYTLYTIVCVFCGQTCTHDSVVCPFERFTPITGYPVYGRCTGRLITSGLRCSTPDRTSSCPLPTRRTGGGHDDLQIDFHRSPHGGKINITIIIAPEMTREPALPDTSHGSPTNEPARLPQSKVISGNHNLTITRPYRPKNTFIDTTIEQHPVKKKKKYSNENNNNNNT